MRSSAFVLCSAVLILSCATASAVPIGMVKGRPNFSAGSDFGYFFWQDSQGFHLRWTTKGMPHVFAGRVESNGLLGQIHRVGTEGGDWVHRTGPRSLKFQTGTSARMDGIDFRTRGNRIEIRLEVDGHLIAEKNIHIGAASIHPAHNPFKITR